MKIEDLYTGVHLRMWNHRFIIKCLATIFATLFIFSSVDSFAASDKKSETEKGYTINFDNVSIKEFLKFISKISGINVIYNEEDLNFNVTIVSEGETSLENIMSALVQILRIHGLSLIEEQKNLLIHKNAGVKQIPTVVSSQRPLSDKVKPPIITKVFKISKGDPSHIASLIIPMLSSDSLVEVSMETRQLIITDVTSSIETIEQLLLSLDTPNTPFEVESYAAQNIPPQDLAMLAARLMRPISDTTTIEIVPQPNSKNIYIVSTPFLIERTLAVLKELDKESLEGAGEHHLSLQNVLIYKIQVKSEPEIALSLFDITKFANAQGFTSPTLELTIKSMKYVKPINSLIFIGPPQELAIIESFLKTIDSPESSNFGTSPRFLIYNIKTANEEQIRQSLNLLADNLEVSPYPDQDLIEAIDTMRWIKATNSLMFTGNPKALKTLGEILPTFDVSPESSKTTLSQIPPNSQFLIYTPKNASLTYLKDSIQEMAKNLKASDLADPAFLRTLESGRVLPTSGQLIYTGDPSSLERVKEILAGLDADYLESSARETLHIVHLQYASPEKVKAALIAFSHELSKGDPIVEMIHRMRILPETNVIIFRGPNSAMGRIQEVINLTDQGKKTSEGTTFVQLEHRPAAEIVTMLHETATKLASSKSASPGLLYTLRTAEANGTTVILSGFPEDIEKVQELIKINDVESKVGKEVYVYKLKYLSASELKASLTGIAEHAKAKDTNTDIEALQATIDSMRPIPDSNTVQFVGSPKTLTKLQEILLILDTPDHAKSMQGGGSNFLVYNVKHANPQALLNHLKQMVSESATFLKDESLLKSVRTGRYASDSHSLIFTGNKPDLDKIQQVLTKLDVTEMPQPTPGRRPEGYKIYRPKFVPGMELIQMIKNFEQHLLASGVMNNELAETIDHLSYVNRTNMIVVTGYDKEVSEVLTLLEEFDNQAYASGRGGLIDSDIEQIDETGFLIYKLQYQQGQEIVNALAAISQDLSGQKNSKTNQALIDAIQTVQLIEITNSLIATGDPKILTRVKELIMSIDRPLKQVFIEILVLDTLISDDLEFGLRWASQGKVDKRLGWSTGNFADSDHDTLGSGFSNTFSGINATTTPVGGVAMPVQNGGYLGAIGDIIWHKGQSYAALGSFLNAIKYDTDSTVVLSQKIVVQDNQNAKIFSGENVPFTGSLVTTAGLSQTTNANLEYRNIGITVSITPLLGDNGTITLDIDYEISEEEDQGNTSSSVTSNALNGIRTSKTSMMTKVHMPDKHFLVLSGTMRNQVSRSTSGIPCLGGLPLIGAAFTETTKLTSKRNVVIFIKPHIIETPEVHVDITRNQEDIFGSHGQANVEDFHRGLELVRSPDDADES